MCIRNTIENPNMSELSKRLAALLTAVAIILFVPLCFIFGWDNEITIGFAKSYLYVFAFAVSYFAKKPNNKT